MKNRYSVIFLFFLVICSNTVFSLKFMTHLKNKEDCLILNYSSDPKCNDLYNINLVKNLEKTLLENLGNYPINGKCACLNKHLVENNCDPVEPVNPPVEPVNLPLEIVNPPVEPVNPPVESVNLPVEPVNPPVNP